MGFNSEKLLADSRTFSLLFHELSIDINKWSVNSGIGENTAYAYQDPNRLDNNLPAFLIPSLPGDKARVLVNYISKQVDLRTLSRSLSRSLSGAEARSKCPDPSMPSINSGYDSGSIQSVIKQFLSIQKEFTTFSRHIIESLEDGTITEYEYTEFEKKYFAFFISVENLRQRLHNKMQEDRK